MADKKNGNPQITTDDTDKRMQSWKALQRSRDRYRLLAENVSDVIFTMDMDMNFTYISPSIERLLGYSEEEAIVLTIDQILTLSSLENVMRTFSDEMIIEDMEEKDLRRTITYEVDIKHKDGSVIPVESKVIYLRDDRDKAVGLLGVSREITERKKVEQELRHNEQHFRALIENALDVIVIINEDGAITYESASIEHILGYTPEEVIGESGFEFLHPDDLPAAMSTFAEAIEKPGEIVSLVVRAFHKDGSIRCVETVARNLLDNPAVKGLVINMRDITNRKQAEEALQESEDKYRSLIENAPNIIMTMNLDGIIQSINRTVSGLSPDEVIGKSHLDYITPEYHDLVIETIENVIKTGEANSYQVQGIRADGEESSYQTYIGPLLRDGEVIQLICVVQDISERKLAEEALRRSEERFRSLIENTTDAIVLIGADGISSYISPAAHNITGYKPEEREGKSIFDLIHPDDISQTQDNFTKIISTPGASETITMRIRHKDGSWRCVDGVGTNLLHEPNVQAVVCNYKDVTERKRAEEELKESETKFLTAFHSNPSGMAISKLENGEIIDLNKSLSNITGYTYEESLGRTSNELGFWTRPDDREAVVQRMKDHNGFRELEFDFRHKSGEIRSGLFSTEIIHIKGNPSILTALVDITERKQAEEALRSSSLATETSMSAIFVADLNGIVTYANSAAAKMWGYKTTEEMIGTNVIEYWTDSTREKAMEIMETLLEEGFIATSEGLIGKRLDGTEFVVESNSVLKKDADGNPAGMMGSFSDITDRKQAEDALQRQEQYFRSLIESSSDTIVLLNSDGKIQYLSPSYVNLTGRKPLDMIGHDVFDNIHRDDKKNMSEIFRELVKKPGIIIHTEVRIRHKNGSWRWVEATAANRFDDPAVSGIVINARDITERKEIEEEREDLLKKEKETHHRMELEMKRRVEFTRALAHELKTPLTPVIASSDSLKSIVNEEPFLSLVNNISMGAANLNSRIDELLDMARGEIGMLQLRLESVNLIKLVQETTNSMIPRATSLGQSLVLDLPSSLPLVQADSTRIQQVVANLLDNALKFTPKGGEVTVKAKEKDGAIVVEVRDTGKGINKKDQRRLFDPYYRLEIGEAHSSGLGIGLALCKMLVDLHGGEIWVKSHGGSGSVFCFSLPLEITPQQITGTKDQRKLWKALVIEDDPIIVDSISLALQMDWPEVELISTGLGEDGVDLVEIENPDVVVLDLGLPDMSGYDVLEQIRLFSSVPIVILTVKEEESDMVKALEQGADDYIVKPFRQRELLARLKVQMRKKASPDEDGILVCGSLRFNPNTSQLWYGVNQIDLTVIEGRIIESLMKNAGQVVTHARLAEDVWGDDYPGAVHGLRVNIGRLRGKIEEDSSNPQIIITKPSVGYSLVKQI